MEREVNGPVRGVANNSAFAKTPMDLVPLASMLNVRLHAPDSDRPRFGQRPGLVAAFGTVIGGGRPVQALGVIQRSSGVSSYQRVEGGSVLDLKFLTANDTYRYSRLASRFKRTAFINHDGSPFVAFVLEDNLTPMRAFGLLTETADAAGVADANTAKPLAGYDRPGAAGLSDILAVSGRKGVAAGDYDEPAASTHRAIMGLQVAWHPDAGTSGTSNEHTLIFTTLMAPGALTLHTTLPAGYTDGCTYTSISAVNAETGDVLWRNVLKDVPVSASADAAIRANVTTTNIDDPGGVNIFTTNAPANIKSEHIEVTALWTFVSAGPYIYVFVTNTGEYRQRITVGGSGGTTGWAKRVVKTMVRNGNYQNAAASGPGGTWLPGSSLLAVFEGINTNAGAPVATTAFAGASIGPLPGVNDARFVQPLSHWRSGVAEFSVATSSGATTVLAKQQFPSGRSDNANWAEASHALFPETPAHETLRLSSCLNRNPRGGIPGSACLGPSPGALSTNLKSNQPFFVGFTSKGFGVSADPATAMNDANYGVAAGWTWPDDISAQPTTVAKFSAMGIKIWEVDTESLVRDYAPMPTIPGPVWHNDIPTQILIAGPVASVMAMRSDAEGYLFVAGTRNGNEATASQGYSVRKLNKDNGAVMWRRNLAGNIHQDCLRISPTDGTILVCGQRNLSWPGSGANYATIWKLSQVDGTVIASYDFGLDDSLWSPAANSQFSASTPAWRDYHSAAGIDVDKRGRVAVAMTPGV